MKTTAHWPHTYRHALALASAVTVPALALAACGTNETDTASTPDTSTTTMTAEASPSEDTETTSEDTSASESESRSTTEGGAPDDSVAAASVHNGTTEDTHEPAQGDWGLSIADVRAGDHEGFDRVVIELSGNGTPGYFAGYTDAPRQHTSGYPVDMAGDSFFEIGVQGFAPPTESGVETWDAGVIPDAGNHGIIADIYHGGIFEAQGQFLIGVKGEPRPYAVTILENPARVVIDFAE
ncbi:hypothetical protein C3B44_04575 [Corynebacterium yudongzhengii]|uniref:AMIN-like domain-containing protein n=1 Tax=Corynebacterium yudongzhengii TaxID=2080740 RepID=A0A2U1T589_9CORY|nr:hypothetical protein [Corynebacterium yudongzhengii]AWB81729.1 hypothetical protein C3B44_04575 [Corynebacterium yudongzhengii]PWC01162.1 hypothetical protein DF222_08825 [Corynebacterium yudongzhengii]